MSEKLRVTFPATVGQIIKSPIPNEPDQAQIAVEGADRPYGEMRIDGTLKNENGDDVHLKLGAQVEVTIVAEASATAGEKPYPVHLDFTRRR
jgi:hypothetical protein